MRLALTSHLRAGGGLPKELEMTGGTVRDTDEPIKVGGQALADGVLMRTNRAWAIARADGTVESGPLAPSPFARVPVLRVIGALGGALKLAIGRGLLRRGGDGEEPREANPAARRLNRRLLLILAVLEAVALAFAFTIESDLPATGLAGAAATIAPWVVTLAAMRLVTPKTLWRYHGAEHKAVSAYEQGVDLTDTRATLNQGRRIHDRCGTNLVFILLVATVAARGHATGLSQIPFFLAALGIGAEAITLAAKRPHNLLSKLLLAGGKALQRVVTTAEPTANEQATANLALTAALEAHARAVATDNEPVPALALAAAAA